MPATCHPTDAARAASRRPALLVALACAGLLQACAVGPDYQRPAIPASNGYSPAVLPAMTTASPGTAGQAQRLVASPALQADWWTLFQSPALNALIAQALAANPSVGAARAAFAAAQENVDAQQGFFFPIVQANLTSTRQRIAGALTSPEVSGATAYTLHTAQVTVGFVPDVFGGNRRAVEALQSQATYQQLQLEATRITLASNVAAAAIQEAMLRQQIAIANRVIASNRQATELVRRQFKAGFASRLDLSLQEVSLAQANQLLPPLQKQFEQTRNLLRMLSGGVQDAELSPSFELASLTLPGTLPVSLPSRLVEQRPDVRAAEEQLHAASAQIGVALANRLPQFSIDATWGGAANSLGQVLAAPGRFFDLAGSITQPLFDAGVLQHRQRAAEALYEQAAATYQTTVLTAFQNVADCLRAIYADADGLAAANDVEQSTRTSLDLVRRQVAHGYIDRIAQLNAEQTHDQAQLALAQAQATRLGDTIALYQALGGGWWQRDAASATSP